MKQSLKDLIKGIETPNNGAQRFKDETSLFIEEAKKGQDWFSWDHDVFEMFFEKNQNCVAKLGNGQMTIAERASVKGHWMELAPHLKAIAESQDVPLWHEYNEIKNIVRKYTKRNLNVAINRMLAGLQPRLLCTECDINRINKLVCYLQENTDADLSKHDFVNWEKASYYLNILLKSVFIGKDYWYLSDIPWKLLEKCELIYGEPNRKWLVFANRNMWHHKEALHEMGFISWTMHRTNFSIGDEVYLFMSDERRIRFKTKVIADNCERGDEKYRVNRQISKHLTYKLEFVAESMSDDLKEVNLMKHGFNGGRSIQNPMHNNPELFTYIESIFNKDNGKYSYIIDDICTTKRTNEIVRQMIPILVRWAKQGFTSGTYKKLLLEIGYDKSYSGIGKQLGRVDDVFKRLREVTHEDIPTLNALVKKGEHGLPSSGFQYVYKKYNELPDSVKEILVSGLNKKAFEYKNWDWVLDVLGLKPSMIDTSSSEATIRSGKFFGPGGEGKYHKELKEYIYNHPERIGIHNIKKKEKERILLSGDRLDVYFELDNGTKIAVEIKPFTSPDADILRGLFQCVKYKTILDAEDKVHSVLASNMVILVIGGELSPENRNVRDTLNITVKENIRVQKSISPVKTE